MARFERVPFKNNDEFLLVRSKGIGGSDASAIFGKNPYMTNYQLWQEKIDQTKKQRRVFSEEAVDYGHKAETLIREMFRLDYPQFDLYHNDEILVIKDKPYIRGALDGELTVLEDYEMNGKMLKKGMKGVWECKTALILAAMHKEKWEHDNIPINYLFQIIHYLLVTGYDFAIMRAQLKRIWQGKVTLDTRDYLFMREDFEEEIKYLEGGIDDFWNKYVIPKKEPPLILPTI
ncbi:MAG: YqaJ viral recombinase family protein [Dysgonamonadaceae bacterium]